LPGRPSRPQSRLPDARLVRFPRDRPRLVHTSRQRPRPQPPRRPQSTIRNPGYLLGAAIAFMNLSVRLAMVGCTHSHSTLAVRERLAFTPEQTRDALAAWRMTHPDREAVLLSTCHRVELYAAAPDPEAKLDPPALAHYLADFHNVPVEEIGSELM